MSSFFTISTLSGQTITLDDFYRSVKRQEAADLEHATGPSCCDEKHHCDENSHLMSKHGEKQTLTVGDVKRMIYEQHNIPTEFQSFLHNDSVLSDDYIVRDGDSYTLKLLLAGGASCFCIKIQTKKLEWKFRFMCCYHGADCEFTKCQYCCIHCECTIL